VANIPSKIGNFEILGQIGSGGMGAVYLGRDPELDRQVAIKVIREEVHDQEVLDRFFREARAAAALRHANIITVYASGQHDHQPYIAMEYVEGDSLAEIIKERRSLPLAEKLSYLEQICAGLGFAHKAGIVHRDMKPANIMVDAEGVVRILDFGIARIEGSAMTQDGTMMGSLNYMSPEQMLGRPVDLRSDIFSVGSVAYELLSYQQAFKGNMNDGLLHRLPHEDPPSLLALYPGLPPAVARVVMRALEKAPENRFQTLAEMRTALIEAQSGSQSHSTTPVGDHSTTPADDEGTAIIPRPTVATSMPSPSPTTYGGTVPVSPVNIPTGDNADPAPHRNDPTIPPTTGLPKSGGIRLQREAAGTPKVPSTMTPPATMTRAPATMTRTPAPATASGVTASRPVPPPARPVVPDAQAAAPSKKWLVVGGLVAAAGIAAVAAMTWLTAAPADAVEAERPRVVAAMSEYRTAYRNRDLAGVTRVFPGLPQATRQTMQRAFADCVVYDVTFGNMQVALDGADPTQAQVDVRSTHTCTPNSGGRQTTTSQHDLFKLRKNGDAWQIDSAARMPSAGRPQ
jgi:serine/threonine-protein kinase